MWPGREGAALALSTMLRQPLTNISLSFVPFSASYHAAFVGESLYSMSVQPDACVCSQALLQLV